MKKTNNFDEIPKTEEIWIKIGNWILSVCFKDNKWMESIKKESNKEIDCFFHKSEDMETIYLNHCITAYELYCKKTEGTELFFAERTIHLEYDKEMKNIVTIQTGKEDKKTGQYNIDLIYIDKEKWLEIADFFNKASVLFLNFENLIKGD